MKTLADATFLLKFCALNDDDINFKLKEVHKFVQLLRIIFETKNIIVDDPVVNTVSYKHSKNHSHNSHFEVQVRVHGDTETPAQRCFFYLLLDGICGFLTGDFLWGSVLVEA